MTTTTLDASTDVRMYNADPTTNFDELNLIIGQGASSSFRRRSLLKFTMTSIPVDAVLSSAKLKLYATGYVGTLSANNTTSFYRCKRNWVENQATWNVYSTGNSWTGAGANNVADRELTAVGSFTVSTGDSFPRAYQADLDLTAVTEMFDGTWTNYGFVARTDEGADGSAINYYDRLGTFPPQLELTYTTSGGRTFQVVLIG